MTNVNVIQHLIETISSDTGNAPVNVEVCVNEIIKRNDSQPIDVIQSFSEAVGGNMTQIIQSSIMFVEVIVPYTVANTQTILMIIT